jgi:hypothetical protein
MQRIEGDNGALGDAEFGEQGLRRRDLVGLLGDVDMGEHEGGMGGERTQYLRRGVVIEVVEAAAQRLAIQRDAALSELRAGLCGFRKSNFKRSRDFGVIMTSPAKKQ